MKKRKIDLKRRRVMEYFIDATNEIAQKEGIDKVTIRKVADLAGYNSATLYNYFENLDQLLAFSAISAITDYLFELEKILIKNDTALDKFINAWLCFCRYSFKSPPIFTYVFCSPSTDDILSQLDNYLSIFSANIENLPDSAIQTVLGANMKTRDKALIAPCIEEGYFSEDKAEYVNNFAYLLHRGILYQLLTYKNSYTVRQAIDEFNRYFVPFVNLHLLPNKKADEAF